MTPKEALDRAMTYRRPEQAMQSLHAAGYVIVPREALEQERAVGFREGYEKAKEHRRAAEREAYSGSGDPQ